MPETYHEIWANDRRTIERFKELRHRLPCKSCGTIGVLDLKANANPQQGAPYSIYCVECEAFQEWISKDKNDTKRVRRYKIDDVWAENGNRCGFCGVSRTHVELFGIGHHLEVQHVPPLKFAGAEADCKYIPICAWCQQQAASNQKRLDALIANLVERMKGGQ